MVSKLLKIVMVAYFLIAAPLSHSQDGDYLQGIPASDGPLEVRFGFNLVNIDSTLIAEAPKISPYIDQMKLQLSGSLGIPTSAIGIKATTHEKLGSLGNSEGIAAHAIAILVD